MRLDDRRALERLAEQSTHPEDVLSAIARVLLELAPSAFQDRMQEEAGEYLTRLFDTPEKPG